MIRALSASETNEQREIEKAKLEKEYKRSDQRLEELVSSHDQDLMEVMQVNTDLNVMKNTNTCSNCILYHITFCFRYSVHYLKRLHYCEKKFML